MANDDPPDAPINSRVIASHLTNGSSRISVCTERAGR